MIHNVQKLSYIQSHKKQTGLNLGKLRLKTLALALKENMKKQRENVLYKTKD